MMRRAAIALIGGAISIMSSIAAADPAYGWLFHRDVTPSGKSLCSLVTGPKSGGVVKNLAIKQFGGSDHLNVTLYKDTWNIPRGTTVVTSVDFMDNEPLTLKAYGDGKIVDIAIPKQDTHVFLSLVRDSSFLQVGFPNGSEPTWSVDLAGVTPSLKKFVECAVSLPRQNTQPF